MEDLVLLIGIKWPQQTFWDTGHPLSDGNRKETCHVDTATGFILTEQYKLKYLYTGSDAAPYYYAKLPTGCG